MSYSLKCIRVVLLIVLLSIMAAGLRAGESKADFDRVNAMLDVSINGQQSEYDIVISIGSDNGTAIFDTDETQEVLSQSGQPQIPYQKLQLLMPAGADLATVKSQLEASYSKVSGSWEVAPMPPVGSWDEDGNEIVIWPEGADIEDGYDIDIYGSDSYWPEVAVKELSKGQLRSYKLVEVAVPLFRYNPVTGSMLRLSYADVSVKAVEDAVIKSGSGASVVESTATANRVRQLAVNYDDAASGYRSAVDIKAPSATNTGYVILTTKAIVSASNKLASFVADKAKDYKVTVVTEDVWGGGSGVTASLNVRSWLQANYTNEVYGDGGILYVLIIGNPNPSSSSIPMMTCVEYPSDYFYGELTSDWDADGDGVYGEEEDTKDKYCEVYTGRIPYYGTISDTDAILQKLINYNNATDKAWRRNALLPMIPFDDTTPAYQLGEQIKYNILEPKAIPSTRIYEENYGLSPKPEYLYGDKYPATQWAEEAYGMVIWSTHGSQTSASSIINTSYVSGLNDNYPSAIWEGSCQNAWPENSGNLAYSILKNGGIGTVAATRNSLYWVSQTSFTYTNSIGGLGYQYALRLADHQTIGQALWGAKERVSYWMRNYIVFNLYGDPSTQVMPEDPEYIVSPTDGVNYNVVYGGSVSDSSSYTITNNGSSAMEWTASTSGEGWYSLSGYSGTIEAGGTADVTVSVSDNTNELAVGEYKDTIIFSNSTTGEVFEREVSLTIEPKKMVAYWPFDEKTGTTVYDYSENGYDGTVVNTDMSTASINAGKSNSCFRFDGVDDHVVVEGLDAEMSEMTISAWIYSVDWNSNRRIIQKGGDGSEYRLLVERSNFVFQIGSTSLLVSELPPTGQWVHIAAVYDGSNMSVYYNKELMLSTPLTGMVSTGSNDLYIGTKAEDSASTDRFNGVIDELKILNYGVDEQELADLYDCKDMAVASYPCDGAGWVVLSPELSWTMGMAGVSSDVYFGTDRDAVFDAGLESEEYCGRESDGAYEPGRLKKNSTYYWRVDLIDSSGNIDKGAVWQFSTADGRGGILWQGWTNISGSSVSGLVSDADFPDNPDYTKILPSFDGPVNWAENYGTQMKGYFIAPVTGEYTFWVASDDNSELYLSSDITAENATMIAYLYASSGKNSWDAYTSQKSGEVTLKAGNAYYIRTIHKEGSGNDHMSVAFSAPGYSRQLIEGKYLVPYGDLESGLSLAHDKVFAADAVEGVEYSYSLAEDVLTDSEELTFTKLAGPLWLDVNGDGTLSGRPVSGDVGCNLFEVEIADNYGGAITAVVQVEVVDLYKGEFALVDFAGFAAQWLQGDCADSSCQGADLNGDGSVDIADVEAFADSWMGVADNGEGLTYYWPFDSDYSDVINGYAGGSTGAYIAEEGASYELYSGSLVLDGVDDYVEVEGLKGVAGSASRSCTAWVKTTAEADGTIMSWGADSSCQKWLFRVEASGRIGLAVWGGMVSSDVTVNDGNWHHVAVVLMDDGNCTVSDIKFYIDGELCETIVGTEGAIDTVVSQNVIIGSVRINGNMTKCFAGSLDEVKLYNRALTSEEVAKEALKYVELSLPLNEGAGTDVSDVSLNDYSASVAGSPVWDNGVAGSCLSFDGVDDYLMVSGYTGVVGSASRTCCAWVKTTAVANAAIISWGADEVGKKWLFRIDSNGYPGLAIWGGAVYSDVAVNDGQWHHVAVVLEDGYDADMSNVRLYIDGRSCGVLVSAAGDVDTKADQSVIIGAMEVNGNMSYKFSGLIDEVKVYGCALSGKEIERLYQSVQ